MNIDYERIMCCPNCESDSFEQWIITDETNVHTDSNGNY